MYVPSLVKIHGSMLILEWSQGCYGRTDGRQRYYIPLQLRWRGDNNLNHSCYHNPCPPFCYEINDHSCHPCPPFCYKCIKFNDLNHSCHQCPPFCYKINDLSHSYHPCLPSYSVIKSTTFTTCAIHAHPSVIKLIIILYCISKFDCF